MPQPMRANSRPCLSDPYMLIIVAGFVVMILTLSSASAAPPPNDDCTNAIDINSIGAGCVLDSDLGSCAGSPSTRPCSISAQNCPAGEGPCFQWADDTYSCGPISIDNTDATTDGPPATGMALPWNCVSSGANAFQADVWYNLPNPCYCLSPNTTVLSTCGTASFDTMIEVHAPCDCASIDESTRWTCNDEGCDNPVIVGPSTLEFDPYYLDDCFKIRVGGFEGSQGTATIDISIYCWHADLTPPFSPFSYPHAVRKNRYISFSPDPTNAGSPHGYQVRHVASGRAWFISPPLATPQSIQNENLAVLLSDPVPPVFDWGTLPVVHVMGCDIMPGETYEVRATPEGCTFSTLIVVTTTPLPTNSRWWADVVGVFSNSGDASTTPPTPANSWTPPDGSTNGFDVTAILRGFQKIDAPHVTWTDLNPEIPDRVTNGNDVLRGVNAFASGTGREFYPFNVPNAPGPQGQGPCPTPPLEANIPP